MRKRFLTVLKNENGIREYDSGVEQSENMEVCELPENEFEDLCNNGLFKKINDTCELMIDDFESEVMYKEDMEHFAQNKENMDLLEASETFKTMFEKAQKTGVALAMDF